MSSNGTNGHADERETKALAWLEAMRTKRFTHAQWVQLCAAAPFHVEALHNLLLEVRMRSASSIAQDNALPPKPQSTDDLLTQAAIPPRLPPPLPAKEREDTIAQIGQTFVELLERIGVVRGEVER